MSLPTSPSGEDFLCKKITPGFRALCPKIERVRGPGDDFYSAESALGRNQ